MEDYREYAKVFNTGDDEKLVSTFFAFPFTFTTPFVNKTYQTKEEFLEALIFYHRVRECIDPQEVLYGKGKVFVNLDIIFHSCVEWLDFAYGPVRPGDMLITRAFVVYTLNEQNRVVQVKEMYWPAGYLNKSILRLGGSEIQRAGFEAFIAGFNAGNFDAVGDYYTEGAVVEFHPDQKMVGRGKIVEGFKETDKTMKVTFETEKIICDDGGICLHAKEKFVALADVPEFLVKPMKRAESFSRPVMIVFVLSAGLISGSKSMVMR